MRRIKINETYCISNALEDWLRSYKATTVVSKTVTQYRFAVEKFIDSVGNLPIDQLSPSAVDDFKIQMLERNLSAQSINSYLRSIRTFTNWLIRSGKLRSMPVKMIKAEKPMKNSYTEIELQKLLGTPPPKRDFANYRNWVAISVLVGTGCRRRTLLNIKVGDIDFANNIISMRVTKSKRSQMIPMTSSLADIIRGFIKDRNAGNEDYLICNSFGDQMLENGFTHEIQKYNRKRGVTKTSVHLFRHTFAKMYLQAGGNVVYLSKILGHQSISTTMEYISLNASDLKQDFDQLNPLTNLRLK